MAEPKSKIVLFIAVTFQTMLAGVLLAVTIPYYVWGPAPADELAMEVYAKNAGAIARLIAAIWAGVVCVTYYLCFMRHRAAGGASKTSTAQKRD